MNPFDGPPSSPPVSFDRPPGPPTEPVEPPAPAPGPEPRRGRMVAGVFAAAVLLGAAAFGVSELASADDDPDSTDESDAAGTDESSAGADDDAGQAGDADDDTGHSGDTDDDTDRTPSDDPESSFHADGELRFDLGDGEPIIIDLDDIDPEALGEFADCIGLPGLEFGDGLPGLDPEWFDQEFDRFFEEMPSFGEEFDRFFEEMPSFGEEFDRFFEEMPSFGEEFDRFFEEMPSFGEDFDRFFEDMDPEQFDRFLEDMDPEQFDEFFGEFEFDGEPVDPEQFEQELGPLLESGALGELFDRFFENIDPELFDQFFENMPPFGGEFGEHEAGHRGFERPAAPEGGSWLPSGLDREQIEACLAELD